MDFDEAMEQVRLGRPVYREKWPPGVTLNLTKEGLDADDWDTVKEPEKVGSDGV
ncbi:MAG: hypothetical protein KAV87_66280 [Desulfobacteraceae bacterium]|nr:hypothetical protein [Desulfobacteraceae bacterium]